MPEVKKNVIFGVVLEGNVKNKLFLLVDEKGLNGSDHAGQKRVDPIFNEHDSYFFELRDQLVPLYFSLLLTDSLKDVVIAKEFHFEPGDQIRIGVKGTPETGVYDLDFSGKGVAKYNCLYELHAASKKRNSEKQSEHYREGEVPYGIIEKYRSELSAYSYHLLHADITGELGRSLFSKLETRLQDMLVENNTSGFEILSAAFLDKFKFDFVGNIPDQVLLDSKEYASFVLARIRAEVLIRYQAIHHQDMLENINKIQNTALKDKILAIYAKK